MFRKILVPLDGSTLAEQALPHAEAIANAEHAELVILRVPLVPALEFFGHDRSMASAIGMEADKEADQYVKEKVRKLKWKVSEPVCGVVREGPVAETILAVADELHADLIAMSTHGRTGLMRVLVGSVANDVVHMSHVPVMLIHPN